VSEQQDESFHHFLPPFLFEAVFGGRYKVVEKQRNCDQCGNEYEPKYYDVLGTHLLAGRGRCPDCAQKKYDEEVAKETAALQASIIETRRRHRELSGIPFKFMNQDFSSFEKGWQDEAFDKCWKYAEAFPVEARPIGYPSLYIYSEKSWGVGKTHLTCAIAHRILDRWKGGERGCPRLIFVSEPDLFRQIQATYSFNQEEKRMRESEDDIIKRLTYCDLLELDDVGKERRQDPRFVQRTLFAIIDGRYKLGLPMILTANLVPSQLRAHLEEATFDRFSEMSGRDWVRMDGNSYWRK